MSSTRIDLYQTVTDQIIAALEAGTPPWICPWSGGGTDQNPANLSSGKAYRGINVLLLNLQSMVKGYHHNRWLTFLQAQQLGGRIKRGEQGTQIVFFKMHEVRDAKVDSGQSVSDADARVVPLLRSFTVFNVDQIDGLPPALCTPVSVDPQWSSIDHAEQLLTQSGAVLRHGGDRAFYTPTLDFIQMPGRSSFASAADYYATALHELTHWTSHPTRCNRTLGKRHEINAYAFEELVAEMGAAFLTNHCRIEGRLQHASYIASWLHALKNDRRLIFTAASQAQRAADFLLQVLEPLPKIALAQAA